MAFLAQLIAALVKTHTRDRDKPYNGCKTHCRSRHKEHSILVQTHAWRIYNCWRRCNIPCYFHKCHAHGPSICFKRSSRWSAAAMAVKPFWRQSGGIQTLGSHCPFWSKMDMAWPLSVAEY
jgi:hypothetical protein